MKYPIRFENPSNGFVEESNHCGLWCLLFGLWYFACKGIWKHFFIYWGAAIFTLCLSAFVYPFLAREIVRKHYLSQGWIELPNDLQYTDISKAALGCRKLTRDYQEEGK